MNFFPSFIKSLLLKSIPRIYSNKQLILPPKYLRYGGNNFFRNNNFALSARKEVQKLITNCGITHDSTILDVGCGPGRLAIGILDLMPTIKEYQGVDVDKCSIDWCKKFITKFYPKFQFTHINVYNARYNKKGEFSQKNIRLPFENKHFDSIYLYSVFSHLSIEDIEGYLKEFTRLLKPKGKILLTAFLEEGVPCISENPKYYLRKRWHGPLHCVLYNKDFFENKLNEFGFKILKFCYGTETDNQSMLIIDKTK